MEIDEPAMEAISESSTRVRKKEREEMGWDGKGKKQKANDGEHEESVRGKDW